MQLSVLRAEAQKHIVSYQNVSVKAIIYPETILLEVVRAAPVAVVHIADIKGIYGKTRSNEIIKQTGINFRWIQRDRTITCKKDG
mgnify:CR=1 FL=1|nr:hypothetical protein [Flexilinea flocculi]